MTFDYQKSNSLNKYPFVDNCIVTSQVSFVLPNDFILDAVVSYKSFSYTTALDIDVSLVSYTKAVDSYTFTFGLAGMGYGGGTAFISVNVPFLGLEAAVQNNDFFYNSENDCSIKLILGEYAITEQASANRVELFDPGTAVLNKSCVFPAVPKVSSITFKNNGVTLTSISGSELDDIGVVIEEGANLDFSLNNSKILASVKKGAGRGLYDDCGVDLTINTINSIAPNNFRNFILNTDDCYVTSNNEYGLMIENICTPKCTTESITNFAYYNNRVKDGLSVVTNYAGMVFNFLNDHINYWVENVYPFKNRPYYKYSFSKFIAPGPVDSYYYSCSIGLYNPSRYDITATVSAKLTYIDDPSYSMGFRPGKLRFKNSLETILLDSPEVDSDSVPYESTAILDNVTIPCVSNARFEFVVHASIGDIISVAVLLDGITQDPLTLTLE